MHSSIDRGLLAHELFSVPYVPYVCSRRKLDLKFVDRDKMATPTIGVTLHHDNSSPAHAISSDLKGHSHLDIGYLYILLFARLRSLSCRKCILKTFYKCSIHRWKIGIFVIKYNLSANFNMSFLAVAFRRLMSSEEVCYGPSAIFLRSLILCLFLCVF